VRSREISAQGDEISPLARDAPSVEMTGGGIRFNRSVEMAKQAGSQLIRARVDPNSKFKIQN
jgi:hypothetical protein